MKYFILLVLIFISLILVANPYQTVEPVLEYPPVAIMSNYYDLTFTSAGDAVSTQPDDVGGGTYYVFQAKETAASTCRVYYGYQDCDYTLASVAAIGVDDFDETKPALAIDSVTGDPIVVWNRENGIVCSYDLYHLGCPGLWKTPFYIFDENTWTPNPDDNFKDPIIKIGPSPDPGKRRVYVLLKNHRTPEPYGIYYFAMLMYADFDVNDLNMQSELNWTYFPIYDNISLTHSNLDFTFEVSEDLLTIIGYDNESNVFAYTSVYGYPTYWTYTDEFKFPVDNPLNLDGTPRFPDDQGNPYELYFKPMFSSNSNAISDQDDNIYYPISFGLAAEPDIFPLGECLLYPKLVKFVPTSGEFSFFDLLLEGDEPNDNNPAIPWDIDEDGQVDSYDMEGKVDWIPSWPVFYHDNILPYPEDLNNMRVVENEDNFTLTVFWNDGTKAHFAENTSATLWQDKPEMITATLEDGNLFFDAQYLNSIVIPELADIIPEFFYPSTEFVSLGNATYSLNAMFYDANAYCVPGQNNGGIINASQIWFIPDEQDNYIGISHPTSNDIYAIGDEMEIDWYYYGSSLVAKIDLVHGQDEFIQCVTDDPGDDNFLWTIPENIPVNSNYRIRLMGLSPPEYYLSQPFSITNSESPDDVINFETALYQNTPNPFNPSTEIRFQISDFRQIENAEITIYNLKGQKVKTLPVTPSQSHSVSIVWDGTDQKGEPVSSGVYLYKLKAGEFEESKKMLLLR
ncbi:MAG: T9SS type A sorting domain-containing protein [Candidatus Cloacimonetes bacterium]|nr:T9SS type A sorting domain-containing protein [Candidatus Cloacimonadota bacterium]MCF7813660.1 T9SS type A sorting domain-containing protein [Candidatus Cloacimonadota bacterium]MCF7869150.1 T9SS type A sorting domain-containing protein [Candidatus Cloacimonadota bacterium]MCF7882496.1 T9SS type A sorting domain-containing protein [Candidatus Cloacimonadota bacterium]